MSARDMTGKQQTTGPREVFRPQALMYWAVSLSALIVIGLVAAGFGLSPTMRVRFTLFQLSTLFVIAGGGIFIMMSLALSRVVADADGLTIRNSVHTRRLRWDEIRDVRWGPGASWAQLILDDDPTHPSRWPMLALQTVDRRRTDRAVRRLREMLREHRGDQPNG
ncbi:hypothetical protein CGZ94_18385 [Enemella evansiae]|uniref:Low molecular weight protein antigen 6 PH domain-containing protein n=2 Tax=Enemella evansiae TaxID=2016499 RepID=A0A255G5Y2_9ACTN|nr:PH domain-containing protein [Enemella evansiae]OYO09623.1 hypothetical protein CGZ94_18385 [Enemella evansiae]